jgi:hypothetical protein
MRIGDTIQAGLNAYDPSPYLSANRDASQAIAGGIQQGVGAMKSAIDRRAEYKQDVKMGKELAKAMKTLYPEIAPTIDPYLAELDNDENPLSHQAALGKGVSTVISQYIGERDNVFERSMRERALKIDESRHKYDTDAMDRALRDADQARLEADQMNALVAPDILNKLYGQTAAMEKAGQPVGISSAALQQAMETMTPRQMMGVVKAGLEWMPEQFKREINYNTPVTINGQPGTMPTVTNPDGTISPVAWGDGSAGVSISQDVVEDVAADPIKSEIAKTAAKYGIPPAHALSIVAQESNFDPDTTMESSSAKGLFQFLDADRKQYGVGTDSPLTAQIDAGIRKMKDNYDATKKALGREPTAGELYATYYQGIGAGPAIVSNPKGSFRDTLNQFGSNHANKVINANPWLKGITTNQEFIDWSEAKMKEKGFMAPAVTPGAVSGSGGRTPVQQALDEANLAKIQNETAAAQNEASTKANQAKGKAERVLAIIDRYSFKDANGQRVANGRLDDAVGFGAGVGSYINRVIDSRTQADQQELTRNLIETSLLEAAKDLKPVSEDEMRMLMDRRPKITDAPETWARFMGEAEAIIKDGLGVAPAAGTPAPAAPSAAPSSPTAATDDRAAKTQRLKQLQSR